MRALLFITALASAGCLRTTTYKCETDSQCGTGGACELSGFCSFADSACAGMGDRRYGDQSGVYANKCTGAVGVDKDAAIDTPIIVDTPMGDVPVGNCPSSYGGLGSLTNRYRVITGAAAWANQVAACAADGSNKYLAIPNNQAELTAIVTAANATMWVGVEDGGADDEMFVDVKNAAYPTNNGLWAGGEPDDGAESSGPNNAECVQATTGNSGKLSDDRCAEQYVAVCECEP